MDNAYLSPGESNQDLQVYIEQETTQIIKYYQATMDKIEETMIFKQKENLKQKEEIQERKTSKGIKQKSNYKTGNGKTCDIFKYFIQSQI